MARRSVSRASSVSPASASVAHARRQPLRLGLAAERDDLIEHRQSFRKPVQRRQRKAAADQRVDVVRTQRQRAIEGGERLVGFAQQVERASVAMPQLVAIGLQRQRALVIGERRAERAAHRADVGPHEIGVGVAGLFRDQGIDDAQRLVEFAEAGERHRVFLARRRMAGRDAEHRDEGVASLVEAVQLLQRDGVEIEQVGIARLARQRLAAEFKRLAVIFGEDERRRRSSREKRTRWA